MTTIRAKRMTPKNFGEYGSVVVAPAGVPTSQSHTYAFWADIAHYEITGETEIGLCTVYAQPQTEITGLERHTRTPEILIPIDAPFIVPLLLDGRPSTETEAFRVEVGEAIVISPGVWHGASVPVSGTQATYFVVFRRNTPHEDVAKKEVERLTISW